MAAPVPAPRTELGGVERGLQRASGIGIVAFAAQASVVAVAGWSLYPAWWYAVPAPAMAAAVAVTVVFCFRGRSGRSGRLGAVTVVVAGTVATAWATAETVQAVGNATSPLVTAFAILLGLFEPPVIAIPVGAALIASQTVSVSLTRPLPVDDVATVTMIQAAVLLAGMVTRSALRRAAVNQDALRDRLAHALAADRVAAATRLDRREQERRLHDTVLSTLAAIARSSLTDSERLRDRCAADARYLRTLQRRAPGTPGRRPDLAEQLHTLARDRTVPGFRVDVAVEPERVGRPLPDEVVDALTRAASEGVANAARHSGAHAVEIRVRSGDGGVTVEVLDRGCGADRAQGGDRLGVRRSIVERMTDAGGRAEVRHVPGAGTRVVLTWPA